MRFAEIALLGLPLVVFVAWRLLAPNAGPPKVLAIAVAAAVAIMAVLLFVLRYEDAAPPGTRYEPARLENGRIVPAHLEPIQPAPAESAVTPSK